MSYEYKVPEFVEQTQTVVRFKDCNGEATVAVVNCNGTIVYPPIRDSSMTIDEACDHLHALRRLIDISSRVHEENHMSNPCREV